MKESFVMNLTEMCIYLAFYINKHKQMFSSRV